MMMMGWQGRDFVWWVVIFILFLLPEIYASKANGRSSSLGAPSIIQGKNSDIQAGNAPKMGMASPASPGNQVPFKASLPTPVLSKVKEYSNLFPVPLASDVHPSESLAISPSQQEVKEPFSITHSPLASDPPVIIPAAQGVKNASDITPAPLSHQHSSGSAPATHPVPLEVKSPSVVPHGPSVSHSQPPGSSPMVVLAPSEETEPPNVTNVTHAPLHSPLSPSGSSSPAISPGAQGVKEGSNIIHAPSSLHLHPSGVSPAISPVQKEVKDPSNNMPAPLASQSNPSSSSPVMSPVPHEVKGTPNVTDAPLGSPPDSLRSYPVTSPVPHEGRNISNSTVAPSASQTNSSGRIIQSPSSAPIPPIPHSSESSPTMSPAPHEVEIPNVTYAPKASHSHPSESPPVISPSQHEVNNRSNNAHAPLVSQPPSSGRAIQSPSSVPSIPIPRSSEVAPVMSPAPHEVEIPNVTNAPKASHSHSSESPPVISPSQSPPVISPSQHEVNNRSNNAHAPLVSQPPPSGRAIQSPSSVPPIPIPRSSEVAPVMSPAPHEVEISNVTHAPTALHPHPLESPPVISPTSHEVNPPPPFVKIIQSPSSAPIVSIPQRRRTRPGKHAHVASHSHTSVSPPVISPSLHEGENPSNNAHAPLAFHSPPSGKIIQSPSSAPMASNSQHGRRINIGEHAPTTSRPHPLESSPKISPALHGVNNHNNAHVPLASHLPPSSGRKIQSPSSAPIVSTPQHIARIRIGNPASAPLSSPHPASHHPGHVISPAPSPAPAVFPKNKTVRPAPPPIIQGPLSSVHAPAHPPEVFPKNNRRHHAPSNNQATSLSPILPPFPSTDRQVAHPSSPSYALPSPLSNWPSHSPTLPPSGPFSKKQRAPFPSPLWVLPPPPPNLDCKSLTCLDPLTYPPPGSLCVCVLPIKVGLRLRIALYTFFPLVSELAKEIVAGVFVKQSQVRIMGANADSEDPEKTIVIVYLVPLGGTFDINTALLVYERFFHKQVLISASYFGDYDVLYVTYPGLPPSPPGAPENYDTAGAFGNGNMGKRPLAVDPTKNQKKLSVMLITIIVLSSVVALVLSIGAAWLLLLKCRAHSSLPASTSQSLPPPFAKSSATGPVISRPSSTSASFSSSIAAYRGSTKTFSLAEIERATDRFHDSRIIGEGGFGRVYNALLDDGTMVAVKVLKRDDQQGGREFLAEVEMLSRLHHRNLVKLVGICTEENARCLVYELIPNGSVESHLHGVDKENAPLDWSARIKIALGAARGLAYLHEDSSPRVIHRDFKSSNILLEHDFTPKVSDFGLARTALDEENQHISTRVMGTFGYVAPEYAMTGHLLVKSDVYSYGVVLLELLTGRKPVDMSQPPGQENLVSWALPLLTSIEGLQAIIDPTLGTDIPSDSIAKVAAIASMCVQPEVSHRPFMSEVVQALKLVSNEGDEYKSESGTEAELSTKGSEIRINTGVGLEEERVLSESDIFGTSARFTTDASGSFRRYASSGPLDTGRRSGRLWQRVINFSSGSMREAGAARRSGTGFEGSEQWP